MWSMPSLIHTLKESILFNPNMMCLLNELVVLTHLLNFIKVKKKKKNTNFSTSPIDLNYEKPNKYIFSIKLKNNK